MAALVGASAFAACTASGEPSAGPRATASGPDGEAVTPGPGPTPFAPGDLVLRVAVSEPASLDPMRINDPGSLLVARQLYEGLTRWNPVEERVEPAAAESWTISGDGRIFTFKLRAGMTFHDGTPVTSEDFAFAFNRIAQRKNASDLAYTLDKVEGFTKVNQIGSTRELRGIRAPDPRTLVIELSEPFLDLPTVLTHPALVPLQPAAVEDLHSFLQQPVGNGPFQMAAAWDGSGEIDLEAFDDFFVPVDLDGIRFIPYQDAATSWIPFTSDDLEVAEVPIGGIEAAANDYGSDGFKPLLAGYYYGFNLNSASFAGRSLREAVSVAIDRETIASTVFKGTMEPPRGIVPAGMPGFETDVCKSLCDYDPARARKIVAKLGRRARTLSLEFTQGQPHATVASLLAKNLESVGFRVKTKGYRLDQYLRRLRGRDHQFFRLGWIAEYPVPDVFLTSLFGAQAPDNHTGFSSVRVDRLLTRAGAQRSESRRLELYRRAEKIIMKALPVVPIGSFVTHWAAQPVVEGIEFDVTGGFDALRVSLRDE